MMNDRIYAKSDLVAAGIFEESGNKFQFRDWMLTFSGIESVHHYRKDDFVGISFFIAGGGNIILKDLTMDEFCSMLGFGKIYYVYSDKYNQWFLYTIV